MQSCVDEQRMFGFDESKVRLSLPVCKTQKVALNISGRFMLTHGVHLVPNTKYRIVFVLKIDRRSVDTVALLQGNKCQYKVLGAWGVNNHYLTTC